MQIEKYKNYSAIDFLKDKCFLKWLLFNGEEDMLFWNNVVEEYPGLESKIKEAITLYENNIRFNDFKMSRSEISGSLVSLQKEINKRERKSSKRIIINLSAAVAAAVVIFIIVLPFIVNKNVKESDIATYAQSLLDINDLYSPDTKLILSEYDTIVLNNKESSVEYNEDVIKTDNNIIPKEEISTYNQLIIPYGKRSMITFSDGTKAWVNAGSKLVYPAEFSKEKREIYVNGEIYIEVNEDKKRPFVIKTKQMDIQVLGTKFNVSAYEADKTKSVVLVSGSVSISSDIDNKKVILNPDQMYSILGNSCSVENVDASLYILWVQGLYQFESEKLGTIITRLERYYGIKIECDTTSAELKCSGKLDLKEDINKLLSELSRALPIQYRKNADGIYVINAKS
jgi:transmembrane sensor